MNVRAKIGTWLLKKLLGERRELKCFRCGSILEPPTLHCQECGLDYVITGSWELHCEVGEYFANNMREVEEAAKEQGIQLPEWHGKKASRSDSD